MRYSRSCLVLALCLCSLAGSSVAQDAPAFEPVKAKAWFDEAHRQCAADHGALWGESLCGPIMFIEPGSRQIIANQADAQGQLKAQQGVFMGRLPDGEAFANTAGNWAGVRWIQLRWPMPDDAAERRALMAHESFHRIQGGLGLSAQAEVGNAHLDTLQGRYLMQLEWRALAAAVAATDDPSRRQHANDALLFRTVRYRRFPDAAHGERTLERNEGLAEYTGVVVGALSPAERLALTQFDLKRGAQLPSMVRSFAYATGPAYGQLLDRYMPAWRREVRTHDVAPDALLAKAISFHADDATDAKADQQAALYDGAALLASEQAREQQHQQQIAEYKAALIDGPRLLLPLHAPNVMFNPSTLVALGDAGTVYPTMKVLSDWGSIEVRDGGLLSSDWARLTVVAPGKDAARQGTIEGKGWTLQLNKGWQLEPGVRAGDMILRNLTQGAH